MEYQYKTTTATAAVLHFAEHGFKPAFKGKTGKDNPDYFRAVQIIKSANNGGVSDDRARWLLENYGGETYRVESRFEIAITEPNGKTFAELAADFREKHPNAFGLAE